MVHGWRAGGPVAAPVVKQAAGGAVWHSLRDARDGQFKYYKNSLVPEFFIFKGSTMWNRNQAIAQLEANAGNHSTNRCAKFVRKAVEAGGVILIHRNSAKDYGSSLEQIGFRSVGRVDGQFYIGDIAIIQAISGHPDGHMAMYNGTIWISDFRQIHGLYPGHSYRLVKPAFAIYRYPLDMAAPAGTPQVVAEIIR